MAKVFDGIDARLAAWFARQRMFFVATARSGDGGHVNVSPKGPIEALRVLDEHTLAYLDLVGSGAETVAHLQDNGRIVVMLCAFEGPPRIVRLHGRGEILFPADPRFAELLDGFARPQVTESERAIIVVDVTRVADSCGFGVPLLSYEGERPHQDLSSAKRLRVHGDGAFVAYQRERNARSIDGLPGV